MHPEFLELLEDYDPQDSFPAAKDLYIRMCDPEQTGAKCSVEHVHDFLSVYTSYNRLRVTLFGSRYTRDEKYLATLDTPFVFTDIRTEGSMESEGSSEYDITEDTY